MNSCALSEVLRTAAKPYLAPNSRRKKPTFFFGGAAAGVGEGSEASFGDVMALGDVGLGEVAATGKGGSSMHISVLGAFLTGES